MRVGPAVATHARTPRYSAWEPAWASQPKCVESKTMYTAPTFDRRQAQGGAFMKNGAVAIVLVFAAFGNDFCHPASAQSSVGGPKKQIVVGGAAKQNSPVVPVNKAASIPAAKQNPPVVPVSKGVTVSASSPPPHLKCAAGSCVARGSR
jgi:hypothetical protein